MDQLIAVLQSQGKQFEHGQTTIDSAQVPDTMLSQIRKTASGEPLLIVQGSVAIANVLVNEKANPANSSDAADLAKKRIMAERTQASLQQAPSIVAPNGADPICAGICSEGGGSGG